MFRKIEVENFRGIRHGLVEGFALVNLLVGRNNCGKSTLLEALFLGSGMSNPLLPFHINILRGYGETGQGNLNLDFYNLDTSNPICVRLWNETARSLRISVFEREQGGAPLQTDETGLLSTQNQKRYGLKLDFTLDEGQYSSELSFDASNPGRGISSVDKRYRETLRCVYLNSKFDFGTSIRGLNSIIENKDERFIVDGLRILEPRIADFVFTDNKVLVDTGLPKRIPINLMGDGARKIVSLLTAVYDCRDGVLLIDEISNGFHHSVMKDLWRVLIDAALRNNTQLFVTTHDMDSIKGLRDAAVGRHDDMVSVFKLQKTRGDELKTYHYSLDSLDYSINQEIEVR